MIIADCLQLLGEEKDDEMIVDDDENVEVEIMDNNNVQEVETVEEEFLQ